MKTTEFRELRKIVYGLNEHNIKKVIEAHEARGWEKASSIKEYGYGFGCLMKFSRKRGKENEQN